MTEIVLTIVVPTFNESANVAELVHRIEQAVREDPSLEPRRTEILFIDDSTDDTPDEVARVAHGAELSISCVHREDRGGGLGSAVLLGVQRARGDLCLVMDGDLQHPPEKINELVDRMRQGDVDVVVASRYGGDGNASGLSGWLRHGVSRASTVLVRAMFPIRLHDCTDPMTGFFLVDRRRVEFDDLRPRGFKILLEMLAREQLAVAEVPFEFSERHAGDSKATFKQGWHFLRQLVQLRFGRMSGFALVGAVGAIVNVALVWLLTQAGAGVVLAAVVAAEVTIVGNFLVWDRYVFGDIRHEARGFWGRFVRSFAFNNVEAVLRIWLVVWMVDRGWMGPAFATAVLLAIAFVLRYVFHALVVYAPKR